MQLKKLEKKSDNGNEFRRMIKSGRDFLSVLDTYKKEFNVRS